MHASCHQELEMFIRDHSEQFTNQIFGKNVELTKLNEFLSQHPLQVL